MSRPWAGRRLEIFAPTQRLCPTGRTATTGQVGRSWQIDDVTSFQRGLSVGSLTVARLLQSVAGGWGVWMQRWVRATGPGGPTTKRTARRRDPRDAVAGR